jgi:hypothetical protein
VLWALADAGAHNTATAASSAPLAKTRLMKTRPLPLGASPAALRPRSADFIT